MIAISTSGKTKMPVLCDWEIRLNKVHNFPESVFGKLVADYKKDKAGTWVGYGDVEQVWHKDKPPTPPRVKLESGLTVQLVGDGDIGYLVDGTVIAAMKQWYQEKEDNGEEIPNEE